MSADAEADARVSEKTEEISEGPQSPVASCPMHSLIVL
jgi:hypothetical protein